MADLDLPSTGVLQLFHDRETYGTDRGDGNAGAWQLEWIENPTGLLKPPRSFEASCRKPAAIHPIPVLSIPSIDTVGLRGEAGERYSSILDYIEDDLAEVLPLAAGDEYFLLFDIAGVRHLEDWFGDSGHVQVWIRRSDLRARRFDQVWCVIRTD